MKRQRLDAELVRRGLARSRGHAADLVSQRAVVVKGTVAAKPATQVNLADPIEVKTHNNDAADYVSRGAHKLAGALDTFPIAIKNRRCIDAGASTGGFTDVLLRRGAQHVVAVDVGYGQLAWSLQQDDRVTVMDRTNIRLLSAGDISPPAEILVSDLSFISLKLVLPAMISLTTSPAELILMVKPQFEVGREKLGSSGVVRDPKLRIDAVTDVAEEAERRGLHIRAVTASPLPGPSGNVEYFLWAHKNGVSVDDTAHPGNHDVNIRAMVIDAVAKGPQGGDSGSA